MMIDFDRIVIVNLDRRPDRWLRIRANLRRIDWPFDRQPERVAAFDGRDHPPPEGFGGTAGAWGCFRSHLAVCNAALRDGVESLLIFEDDALLLPDFDLRARRFLDVVPDDWEMLYLGGRHWEKDRCPVSVNREVLQGFCVLGTWAYALRGRAIDALRDTIDRFPHCLEEEKFNVDRIFGSLQSLERRPDRPMGELRTYTPWRWMVHHGEGLSDTNGLRYRSYHFDLADELIDELRAGLTQEEVLI